MRLTAVCLRALTVATVLSLGGCGSNEHADHNHEGHDHASHEGHDHASHEGHDHASHEGHDHASHEGHDHASHEGHDHASHAGHDHASHEDEPEDPEVAALRAEARASMSGAERGKAWDPSEEDHHDHSGHDHGDHSGHDHGEEGDAHAGHDHGDEGEGHDGEHEGHDHGGHEGHDHGADGDEHAGHDPEKPKDPHAGHDHGDGDDHTHHEGGHEQDSWLFSRAHWIALEGKPAEQWDGRFGPNVALKVAHPFSLERLTFIGDLGNSPGFDHADRLLLEAGDELKLVASTTGQIKHGDHGHPSGPLFVYLHRRGDGAATQVVSPDALSQVHLDAESVKRFHNDQPATFLAYHPTRPPALVSITRISQRLARSRVSYLRRLPHPEALRAQRDAGVDISEAEGKLRKTLASLDQEHGAEGGEIVVQIESAGFLLGGLHITRYKKVIGLP